MNDHPRANECQLHGDEGREPWGPRLRDIEVVRCDHLGSAYVVEMYLVAGSDEHLYRSHHIHFVRDRAEEEGERVDQLLQEIEREWESKGKEEG